METRSQVENAKRVGVDGTDESTAEKVQAAMQGPSTKDVQGRVVDVPQRPANPPVGTRFSDPRGYVVEWDGANWRIPTSGAIA